MAIEGPRANNEEFVFNWSLPTNIDLVGPTTKKVEDRLRKAGWSEDDTYWIQLSFREALINAIAHGNLGIEKPQDITTDYKSYMLAKEKQSTHPTKKRVQVTVKISREKVFIQIRDEGEGFIPEDVPDPLAPENLLKSSGRGIFMMRSFFDSVEHTEGGKEITMIKTKKE